MNRSTPHRVNADCTPALFRPRAVRDGRSRVWPVATACLATILTGCATASDPQPESMRDPQADFAAYRTFGWQGTGSTADAAGDAPLALLDGQLRTAIAAELQKRGYIEAPAGTTPDLRMAYETASADKIENNPVRVGIGVGSWGGNMGGSVNVGSPSVRNYREGTLVIHAVDAARNAEVWQGRVSKKITKGSLEPAAIAQAVAVAMQDFPTRK
jgi:hypothetical protein